MGSETENLSFEDALAELETVVRQLEAGSLPLEKLIAGYERGVKLDRYCRGKLEALERKIEVLTRDDGGDGEWRDFQSGERRVRSERDDGETDPAQQS